MDIKTKQVVYHDWESDHYDDKWSISFDERCIEYAAGRFRKIVPEGGEPYGDALEVGCGTGFFGLNLAQAGLIKRLTVSDISVGMVDSCIANGRRLGVDVTGAAADIESLPYEDGVFDLVVGHAIVHHVPNLATAFGELRRVLRPGGRLVVAGEPTRTGDRIARQWKRVGRIGVKLAAMVVGADRVMAAPQHHHSVADAEAASLEWEVDLHCFAPAELETVAREAGFVDVGTETEELTANWFGWVTRTVEGMVGPQRLGPGYAWGAYRTWQRLFDFDERYARRLVPKDLFYNCLLTGVAPPRDNGPGRAAQNREPHR